MRGLAAAIGIAASFIALALPALAEEPRRFRSSEGFSRGMPYAPLRRKLLARGWRLSTLHSRIPREQCLARASDCRAYREMVNCWVEGDMLCQLDFIDAARRKIDLNDEILLIIVRVTPDKKLVYERQDSRSVAGSG